MPNIIRLIYPAKQGPVLDAGQFPEQVTESRWHQPWSEPVRQKIASQLAIALIASGLIAPVLDDTQQPGSSYESQYHQGFSTPVWKKRGLETNQQQTLAFVPIVVESITPDKWFNPFSEPRRFKVSLNPEQQQALAFVKADPFPESTTIDRYWQPFAEPVRQKPGLSVTQQRATFWSHFTPTVTEDDWHFGWPDTISRPKFGAGQQQFTTTVPFTGESITIDKWLYAFSDPVRPKTLPVSDYPFLSLTQADPFPESTTIDRYWQPLAEPVRQRLGLSVTEQRATFWSHFTPTTEVITEDKWHFGWPDSIFRPKFGAAQQQFLATVATVSENITVDKWFVAFNNPSRIKPRTAESISVAPVVPVVSFSWFNPLNTPTIKPVVLAARQPFLFQSINDLIRLEWSNPLSLPRTLAKPGLLPSLQQFLASEPFILTQPEAVTESRWHQPFVDPVRIKRGLLASEQQAYFAPFVFEVLNADKWFNPLSEPRRFKLGLDSSRQQFLALVEAAPFGEQILESEWHFPWSDPVRVLARLKEANQKAFWGPERVLPNVTIVTMAATEDSADVAEFAILVSRGSSFARVSIKEILGSDDPYSIRES